MLIEKSKQESAASWTTCIQFFCMGFEIYMTASLPMHLTAVWREVLERWDDVEYLEGTTEEEDWEGGKEKTESGENKSKLLLLHSIGQSGCSWWQPQGK